MKALVLHGIGDLRYETDYPKPEAKEGWALIRIKHSGVCGSDLPRTMITGGYNHPLTCGHEFMGVVETPAPGSLKFKGGERVTVFPLIPCKNCSGCETKQYFHCKSYNFLGSRCDGAFAEYCLAPEENLFVLPDNIDGRIGAFIEPMSVALHMVRQSGFKEGQSALVFGAGAIGIITALWLKIFGASKVVLAGRSFESLETARKVGVDNVISINNPEFENRGNFDHCFEVAGANRALLDSLKKVKRKGNVTLLGRDTKDTVIPLKDFEQLMRKEVSIKGCWGYNVNKEEEGVIWRVLQEDKMNLLPLITKEIDLSEGAETIKKMFNKEEYFCKVMFKI